MPGGSTPNEQLTTTAPGSYTGEHAIEPPSRSNFHGTLVELVSEHGTETIGPAFASLPEFAMEPGETTPSTQPATSDPTNAAATTAKSRARPGRSVLARADIAAGLRTIFNAADPERKLTGT